MADVWYPRAVRMPGARAGYDKGRNAMRCCVMHYTVGVDSTNIGLGGYFTFLVGRDGSVKQFCPVDALCWHAGEWNPDGPGIEHEYYEPRDGPQPENILNPAMEKASGALCIWLRDEHGISGRFYDGPRIGRGYAGFITHRSLVQSQAHFDYITAQQWSRMTSGQTTDGAAARRRRGQHMFLYQDSRNGRIYALDGGWLTYLDAAMYGQFQNQLGQSGQDNRLWVQQDYMIDRYRERGRIVGEPA